MRIMILLLLTLLVDSCSQAMSQPKSLWKENTKIIVPDSKKTRNFSKKNLPSQVKSLKKKVKAERKKTLLVESQIFLASKVIDSIDLTSCENKVHQPQWIGYDSDSRQYILKEPQLILNSKGKYLFDGVLIGACKINTNKSYNIFKKVNDFIWSEKKKKTRFFSKKEASILVRIGKKNISGSSYVVTISDEEYKYFKYNFYKAINSNIYVQRVESIQVNGVGTNALLKSINLELGILKNGSDIILVVMTSLVTNIPPGTHIFSWLTINSAKLLGVNIFNNKLYKTKKDLEKFLDKHEM